MTAAIIELVYINDDGTKIVHSFNGHCTMEELYLQMRQFSIGMGYHVNTVDQYFGEELK